MDLISLLGNAIFEYYVGAESGFTEMAYQLSAQVLTLGYAVMLAGLLYFVLTIKTGLNNRNICTVTVLYLLHDN